MVRYWMECEGIVQGVGFRYFAYQIANLPEIEVQGDEEAPAQVVPGTNSERKL